MLLRNISREADRLDDSELLDMIVSDVRRLRRCGSLLLVGFDGTGVVSARTYGTRWYTHACSPEQARATIDCPDDRMNVFEFAVEMRKLPTIGIFNGGVMKEVARDRVLTERYMQQFQDEPPIVDFYGVHGPSLDEAAIAAYYFRTPDQLLSHR